MHVCQNLIDVLKILWGETQPAWPGRDIDWVKLSVLKMSTLEIPPAILSLSCLLSLAVLCVQGFTSFSVLRCCGSFVANCGQMCLLEGSYEKALEGYQGGSDLDCGEEAIDGISSLLTPTTKMCPDWGWELAMVTVGDFMLNLGQRECSMHWVHALVAQLSWLHVNKFGLILGIDVKPVWFCWESSLRWAEPRLDMYSVSGLVQQILVLDIKIKPHSWQIHLSPQQLARWQENWPGRFPTSLWQPWFKMNIPCQIYLEAPSTPFLVSPHPLLIVLLSASHHLIFCWFKASIVQGECSLQLHNTPDCVLLSVLCSHQFPRERLLPWQYPCLCPAAFGVAQVQFWGNLAVCRIFGLAAQSAAVLWEKPWCRGHSALAVLLWQVTGAFQCSDNCAWRQKWSQFCWRAVAGFLACAAVAGACTEAVFLHSFQVFDWYTLWGFLSEVFNAAKWVPNFWQWACKYNSKVFPGLPGAWGALAEPSLCKLPGRGSVSFWNHRTAVLAPCGFLTVQPEFRPSGKCQRHSSDLLAVHPRAPQSDINYSETLY